MRFQPQTAAFCDVFCWSEFLCFVVCMRLGLILLISLLATYDETGEADYLDVLNNAADAYTKLTVVGGTYEFEHDGQLKCQALI